MGGVDDNMIKTVEIVSLSSGIIGEPFAAHEDVYVGFFNLRHCLNDFLREGLGHIGYCISKNRGKGYATKGLELTLIKARQMCIHEVYMSVNKINQIERVSRGMIK